MSKVKMLCVESRMVAQDIYAAGETYSMDEERAAKYGQYFVPADSQEAEVFLAAQAREADRKAAVAAAAGAPSAVAVGVPEQSPAESLATEGMNEEADQAGGFTVPEDVQHQRLHDTGPSPRARR